MSMPQNVLSTSVVSSTYIHGDTAAYSPLVDSEPGGVALNDASQGMFVKLWTLTYVGTDLVLSASGVADSVAFTRANVTELSLAFDQNMRPTIAFVESNQAKLWWYDTVSAAQVFTTLAVDVVNPRVTLDDKRMRQAGNSDVILGYLRGSSLYFRMQRDRYLVEYLLATGQTRGLRKISMNHVLRLQFEFGPVVA